MTNRRFNQETAYLPDPSDADGDLAGAVTVLADREPPARPRHLAAENATDEERISLFWRVFGGTIISVAALVAVTMYTNLNSTVNDLRAEVSRGNEARAEMVKKDEFNTRTETVWNKVQEVQELRGMLAGMKDQLAGSAESRAEQKSAAERLSVFEQRLKTAEEHQKALTQAQMAVSALEQKIAAKDAQVKSLEDDRKDLGRQLQDLRERLAKVEALADAKPSPKIPASKN